MRILLKILLFPVVMALTILVAVCRFICFTAASLLAIISYLLVALAVLYALFYWINPMSFGYGPAHTFPWQYELIILVPAFLISPFGLPSVATFLVELLNVLKDRLRSI